MRRAPSLALLALAALLALLPHPSLGQSAAQARQELKKQLVTLLDQWGRAIQATSSLQSELNQMEQNISREEREALRLAHKQREMAERLEGAQAEENNLKARLELLQRRYHQQLRALYLLGMEGDAGLFASADSHRQALNRSQGITWLLAGQHQRLGDLRAARRSLEQARGNLALEQNQMAEVRANLVTTTRRLEQLHHQRSQLLVTMEQRRLLLIERIAALQEAEARLARAFALPPLAGEPPGRPMPGVREARGHLSPPVQGRILTRPGKDSQPGITMQAAGGATVRAPWGGMVAFAGEISHLGKVVVIDHGEKVHTVLGHLGSIAVSQGQNLGPGEMLGTVGHNGLLYLEVRLETKAEDPRRWLRLDY